MLLGVYPHHLLHFHGACGLDYRDVFLSIQTSEDGYIKLGAQLQKIKASFSMVIMRHLLCTCVVVALQMLQACAATTVSVSATASHPVPTTLCELKT
jgi:hypothetical protein